LQGCPLVLQFRNSYYYPIGVRDLGMSMAELSRRLNLSLSGVSFSVKRGEKIAQDNGYKLMDQ
jgi:hypothetical protein